VFQNLVSSHKYQLEIEQSRLAKVLGRQLRFGVYDLVMDVISRLKSAYVRPLSAYLSSSPQQNRGRLRNSARTFK